MRWGQAFAVGSGLTSHNPQEQRCQLSGLTPEFHSGAAMSIVRSDPGISRNFFLTLGSIEFVHKLEALTGESLAPRRPGPKPKPG